MAARPFLWIRMLRASLLAGALFDAVFGILILAAPMTLADLLGLPLPADQLYLRLSALLLLFLAAFYGLAARDPRRYSGNAAVAAAVRVAGAGFFVVSVRAGQAPPVFLWFAAADLALGVAHGALLYRANLA